MSRNQRGITRSQGSLLPTIGFVELPPDGSAIIDIASPALKLRGRLCHESNLGRRFTHPKYIKTEKEIPKPLDTDEAYTTAKQKENTIWQQVTATTGAPLPPNKLRHSVPMQQKRP